MSATSPHDAPEPPSLATAAPPREPLLDPFVCGIREIEDLSPGTPTLDALAATGTPEDRATGDAPPAR